MSLSKRLRAAMLGAILTPLAVGAVPAVATADSMSISLSSSTTSTGTPIIITISTSANPIDQHGDGPYLYALVQPATAGNCQPTYGTDRQVVGSQATVLVSGYSGQVSTGQSSHSYNFDQFTAGSYTVCAWLETDNADYAGSGDTPSAVTTTATSSLQLQNTDTLAAGLSTSTPRPNIPFTVAFSGSVTPIDQSGDGPYLYALVQPAGAGSCQSTYGTDKQVAGSQATTLVSSYSGQLSTGAFSKPFNFSGPKGSYRVCGWLETDNADYAGSSDSSSVVLATAPPITFAITTPAPACVVPRHAGATLATVEHRILNAHCSIGHIRRVHRRTVRRNHVIGLSPASGTRLATGAAVQITVSLG